MFEEKISLYRSAKDRDGIGVMSLHDFLFGGMWREPVMALRGLISRFGEKEAKAMDEYQQRKKSLPGATISGVFSRRKGDCLVRHSGYIALDIDHGDNMGISDWNNIGMVLRYRPEVACYMHSCSGTGLFAIVRLAYPEKHKEQFQALYDDYKSLGINLDKACSDITRIRFASYDEHPYVNPNAVAYRGLYVPQVRRVPVAYQSRTQADEVAFIDKLVTRLERDHAAVADDYETWYRVGFCFASLGDGIGRSFFHRYSALSSKYNAVECDKKFNELLRTRSKATIAGFVSLVANLYTSGTVSFEPVRFRSEQDRKQFWHNILQ